MNPPMNRFTLPLAAVAASMVLIAAPSAATALPAPASAPAPAKAEQLVRVALTTAKGRIVLDLDRGRAATETLIVCYGLKADPHPR